MTLSVKGGELWRVLRTLGSQYTETRLGRVERLMVPRVVMYLGKVATVLPRWVVDRLC